MQREPLPPAEHAVFADIFAGILIGGQGRRLGGVDKARLRAANGRTFVQDMVDRVTPWVSSIVLAGRAEQAADYPHAHFVTDKHAQAGPLAGLHALLAAAPKPWCWLIAVDMPALSGNLLTALSQARAGAHASGPRAAAVVPVSAHGMEPCAALYHRSLLPAVQRQLAQGTLALRQLIGQTKHVRVPVSEWHMRNVNHWRDMPAPCGPPAEMN